MAVAPVSRSLLQVLIHSVWQVAIVALVVAGLLRFIPAKKTNIRYFIAASSLIVVVLASLTTWSILRLDALPKVTGTVVESAQSLVVGNASTTQTESQITTRRSTWASSLTDFAPWIIGLWGIGSVIMFFRAFRGMAEVRLLLGESNSTEEEAGTLATLRIELDKVCRSLGMRTSVTLQRCSNIASPAVVGIFWSVILVPASMLSGSTLTSEI